MVALYDYATQGPEDLEFSEGDTIDILGKGEALKVNLIWIYIYLFSSDFHLKYYNFVLLLLFICVSLPCLFSHSLF